MCSITASYGPSFELESCLYLVVLPKMVCRAFRDRGFICSGPFLVLLCLLESNCVYIKDVLGCILQHSSEHHVKIVKHLLKSSIGQTLSMVVWIVWCHCFVEFIKHTIDTFIPLSDCAFLWDIISPCKTP